MDRAISVVAISGLAIGLAAGSARADPSSTRLSTSSNPSVYGEPVSLTARVAGFGSGAPGGKVTFKKGKKKLGKVALRAPVGDTVLSAAENHTCALTASGGAKCWGSNGTGKVGDGTTTQRPTPVDVVGLSSGVAAIAVGGSTSCAVMDTGAARCWGGSVGDGTSTVNSVPVDVTALGTSVAVFALGEAHNCVLTDTGGVKCWAGSNTFGSAGDGTTMPRLSPVDVVGLASGVVALAAGSTHTCAVTSAGDVKCWGGNGSGQLGDGTTADRYTPVNVKGLPKDVIAVGAGTVHTCAVTKSGDVWCWGYNGQGRLGDGTTINRTKPVKVVGLTSAVAVTGGATFTCALTNTGGVKCWGQNSGGMLGNGTVTDSPVPVDTVGLGSGVAEVSAGRFGTCAVTVAGAVLCWGNNIFGQLGIGASGIYDSPTGVVGFGAGTGQVQREALFSTTGLQVGKHKIKAVYGGDAAHARSTSPKLNQVVKISPVKAKLSLKPKTPKAGGSVRIKVKFRGKLPSIGKADGNATFWDGKKKFDRVKLKRGKATVRLRDLAAGKHKLKVTYPGNKRWKKSRAKTTFNAK